jgi:hypothetical protein
MPLGIKGCDKESFGVFVMDVSPLYGSEVDRKLYHLMLSDGVEKIRSRRKVWGQCRCLYFGATSLPLPRSS